MRTRRSASTTFSRSISGSAPWSGPSPIPRRGGRPTRSGSTSARGVGVKKTSAQATAHYALEDLIGRQVAAVVNFPPKQIGKFMSEVLVLGFPDDAGEVVLIGPERQVPNGGRLY